MSNDYCNYYNLTSTFHGSMLNIMWTRFDIVIIGTDKGIVENVWSEIVCELKRLDKMLNCHDPESELAIINLEAIENPTKLGDEMWDILIDCKRFYELTKGLFDVTMNDLSKIVFDENNHSIFFSQRDLSINLGGYAKGYAVEKVNKILKRENIQNAFIDFGNSSVLGVGRHPYGDSWMVSVEDPYRDGEVLGDFKLKDRALSTSGNLPNHTGHIYNTLSRLYNEERKIACVIADNSLTAEVLSTTMIIASSDQRDEIMSNFCIEKLLIYNV